MHALLLSMVIGQVPVSTAADDIETIIVTASRVSETFGRSPYSTASLDTSEILNGRPTLTLGEALGQVPGVFVTSRFNFSQDTRLSIRGFGARSAFGIRGVRVLLDGIPLTLPDGQSQVDSIDMAAIGRIGVLRGPAGSLYGNAAGGVLVLSTREPTERTEVEVNQLLGAFDLQKTTVSARGRLGDDVGLSLFASRTHLDGARDNSAAEQVITMARILADLAPGVVLTSQLHYVNGPEAQDPGGLTREEFEDNPRQAAPNNLRFQTGENLSQIQFGSRLVAQLDSHHRFEIVGHAGLRSFEGNIPFRVIEFDRNFYGGQLIYRHLNDPFEGLRSRLAVGVEYQAQIDRRRNEGNADGLPNGDVLLNQEENAQSFGAFVQHQFTIFDNLSLLGSVRYDRIDFDVTDRLLENGDATGDRVFDQVTAQGGIVFDLSQSVQLFTNVSQSFETPTFTELVNSAPDGGLSGDLDAQRAVSIEGGVRRTRGRVTFEATAFQISLDNELLAAEDAQNRSIFVNAGRSERAGLELFGSWQIIDGLELRGAYSMLQTRFIDEEDRARDGARIPGLPEQRLFARLRWMKDGLHIAGEVEYVGDRFADDANANLVDDYALAELRGGYRYDLPSGFWASLTIGIRNVFDVDYADNVRINGFGGRFFEAGPPLHVYGSLTLGWADPSP